MWIILLLGGVNFVSEVLQERLFPPYCLSFYFEIKRHVIEKKKKDLGSSSHFLQQKTTQKMNTRKQQLFFHCLQSWLQFRRRTTYCSLSNSHLFVWFFAHVGEQRQYFFFFYSSRLCPISRLEYAVRDMCKK